MSETSGLQSLYNLLEKYSTLPCSSGAQMFLSSLTLDQDRVSLINNGFIPTLEDPNIKISYRILSAYLIYALYDYYDTPNPFYSHLIKIFDSERIMALTASRGHYLRNPTPQKLNVQVDTEQLIWVLWKILKGEGNELATHTPNSLSEMVVRPDFSEPSVFLASQPAITPHYPTNPTIQQPSQSKYGLQLDTTNQNMGLSNLNSPGLDSRHRPSPIARPSSNKSPSTLTPVTTSTSSRYVIPAHRVSPSSPYSQTSPDRVGPSSFGLPSVDVTYPVDSSVFHIPYTEGWSIHSEAAWMEGTQVPSNKSPQYVIDTLDPRQAHPLTREMSLSARSPGIIGSGRPSSRGSSDTSSERSGSHTSSMGAIGDSRRQGAGASLSGAQILHQTSYGRGHSLFHAAPASSLRSWTSPTQPTPSYQGFAASTGRSEMRDTEKRSDETTGDLLQELTKLSLQHGQSSPQAPVMHGSQSRVTQPPENFEYMAKYQQSMPQYTPRSSSSTLLQGLSSRDISSSGSSKAITWNNETSANWMSPAPISSSDVPFRPLLATKSPDEPSTYQPYPPSNYTLRKDTNVSECIPRDEGRQNRYPHVLVGDQSTPSESQADIPFPTSIRCEVGNAPPVKSPQVSHGSTASTSLSSGGSTQLTQPFSSVISEHEAPINMQDFAKERDELTTAIVLFLTARERVLTLSERRKLQPYLDMLTQPLCIMRPNDIPSLVAKNQDIAVKLLTLLLDRNEEDAAEMERIFKEAERNGGNAKDADIPSRTNNPLTMISTAVNFVSNYGVQSAPTVNDVSPLGGQAAKEKYLAILRDLPPTMQSFNVIGRLLRPSHPASATATSSEDSAEARVASLVRVEVLGGFVSGCVRWIEQAEEEEKEGLVHDNRVVISTANLCRFYASLIKNGFAAADSEVDTAEIMQFALRFSRLDEARSLYTILVAARA